MYNNTSIISIDGGCRTYKTRISKELSRILDIPFLDTGLVYRAFAIYWRNVEFEQFINKPLAFYEQCSRVELCRCDLSCIVKINDKIIDSTIDKHSVDLLTSRIAENIPVRLYLTNVIHHFIGKDSYIVAGRDIGSFVFPYTNYKIFLYKECQQRPCLDEKLAETIKERDDRDANRAFAPLQRVANQLTINTEELDIDEMIVAILSYLHEKGWK